MTFSKPWVEEKKIAFVPVFRQIEPPDVMPPNWTDDILRRVNNDPRPVEGGGVVDRSLKAWLDRVSWGKAKINPVVWEIRTVTQAHVEPGHFKDEENPDPNKSLNEQVLRAKGFHAGILIMLGGRGTGISLGLLVACGDG